MHFKYLDIDTDYKLLEDFAVRCKAKNYSNNSTVEIMINKKNEDYNQTILGLDSNGTVQAFAGCHLFSSGTPSGIIWRLGDRLVNLSRDSNLFQGTSAAMMALLVMWVDRNYIFSPLSDLWASEESVSLGVIKYITTTNSPGHSNETSGKSHKLDAAFKRRGIQTQLIWEDAKVYGVAQNMYLVDTAALRTTFNNQHSKHTYEEGMIID